MGELKAWKMRATCPHGIPQDVELRPLSEVEPGVAVVRLVDDCPRARKEAIAANTHDPV